MRIISGSILILAGAVLASAGVVGFAVVGETPDTPRYFPKGVVSVGVLSLVLIIFGLTLLFYRRYAISGSVLILTAITIIAATGLADIIADNRGAPLHPNLPESMRTLVAAELCAFGNIVGLIGVVVFTISLIYDLRKNDMEGDEGTRGNRGTL